MDPEPKDDDNTPTTDDRLDALVTAIKDKDADNAKLVADAIAVASTPRPNAPADPVADYQTAQRKYETGIEEATVKYGELTTAGNYADALKVVMDAVNARPAIPQIDAAKDENYLAAQDDRIEDVRGDSDETRWMFETYGEDIDKEIAKLPIGARVTRQGIRRAVRTVKAANADAVIERGIEERIKGDADKLAALPPSNLPSPSLGETRETPLHGLDQTQREAAKALGVSYEVYASQASKTPTHTGAGVPLLD